LKRRTNPKYLHKIKAYINIYSNKEANKLAKAGAKKSLQEISIIYQNAHMSPYWLHKAKSNNLNKPWKDPIRDLKKFLDEKEYAQQKADAINYQYIDKWVNNK